MFLLMVAIDSVFGICFFFVPQVPVQSVLLLLRNVNRKDAHHLTALLVESSAAAVSSSLLGCYISFIEKQNNISVK